MKSRENRVDFADEVLNSFEALRNVVKSLEATKSVKFLKFIEVI